MKLSEEEIVCRLAKRLGLGHCFRTAKVPDYLHSHDALTPVLNTLTAEERTKVLALLWQRSDVLCMDEFGWELLTFPPADLARAIAEVIHE